MDRPIFLINIRVWLQMPAKFPLQFAGFRHSAPAGFSFERHAGVGGIWGQRIEDRRSRIEDRSADLNSQFSIFDFRSSILDPQSSDPWPGSIDCAGQFPCWREATPLAGIDISDR